MFFDGCVGEFGGADAGGVGDVEFAVEGGDFFGALDRLLERADTLRSRFGFQEHDDEMAWIILSFGGEGVTGEEGAEFGGGAEEVVGGDFVVLFGGFLSEEFEG